MTGGGERARGERGAGLVVGLVLMFAFTFLGLVWLARDVDRAISNRSAAQAIAFQAARSGAQMTEIARLRDGTAGPPLVDGHRARVTAATTARQLFAGYGVSGSVRAIQVDGDEVTVTVAITDGGRTVTGRGTVRAERAP
jgi:Tfp pilus assembly protein PilX